MKPLLASMAMLVAFSAIWAMAPHFMSDPAISPDGTRVCFSYMGSLWTVPFEGGRAEAITMVPGFYGFPAYSPDGKHLAFVSNRDGAGAIYVMPATGGPATKVCDEGLGLCGWYADSKHLLAEGNGDLHHSAFYKVSIEPSRPVEIVRVADTYASLSPDNKSIIFNRRGDAFREKYSGSANGELWRYNIADGKFTRLTFTETTERYPKWSATGKSVYFAASDGEAFQLYRADNGDFRNPVKLSDHRQWSVRDIDIAVKNDRIVYELFDEIWTYEPSTGKNRRLDIDIAADCLPDTRVDTKIHGDVSAFAVSPDGKWAAFSAKFDLFAVPVEGGEVKQLTFEQKGVSDIRILDDNRTILFSMNKDGVPTLYQSNITKPGEYEELPWGKGKYIEDIETSPDGNLIISYSEGDKRDIQASVNNKLDDFRVLYDEVNNGVTLSADSKYAFISKRIEPEWSSTLLLRNMDTGKVSELVSHEGYLAGMIPGTDGKTLFFTRNGAVYRLDLQGKDDFVGEKDHWKDILADKEKDENSDKKKADEKKEKDGDKDKDADKADKKPKIETKIDLHGIATRESQIIDNDGWDWVVWADDDSTLYTIEYKEDENILRKVNYKGEKDEELATIKGNISDFRFEPGSKCFYYMKDRNLWKMPKSGKKPEMIEVNTKYSYDRLALNKDIFRQVWTEFGFGFYDPKMHGVDWKGLLKRYLPYTDYAYKPSQLETIVDEMIGDVNASHTGFYPRSEDDRAWKPTAELGLTLDYRKPLDKGIAIGEIYRGSTLYQAFGLRDGDVVLSIDGVGIDRNTEINPLLRNKVGEKIRLQVSKKGKIEEIEVKGLGWGENRDLAYDHWVWQREELVSQWSDNEIGYLHIRGMDGESFRKFQDDLYGRMSGRKALIIDVRYNGGGHTHDQILEVLTKKQYAWSSSRYTGAVKEKTPGRTFEKPMVVLINEGSFSDAEIFPLLFRHLKIGKVIGMPTSGGVIGTGHINFMDGSSMRMPMSGWFTIDGKNMEGMGAAPDILVDETPEDVNKREDVQLRRAVEELKKSL